MPDPLKAGDLVWVLGTVEHVGPGAVKVAIRGLNSVLAIVRPSAVRSATLLQPEGPPPTG